MVKLRTRKRGMRVYGGNHHEKLGLRNISCASQFIIPDVAGTSPDPVCNHTDPRSSQPNQASRNSDRSNPFVLSTLFLSSSPIFLFLVHYSTIIAEHKVKLSLSILPCHDHELAPRIAYTEYSIYQVQHTQSTASIQDCLSSLHSRDHKMTSECSFSFWRASPWELKGNVTLSHSHSCELTNWWKESQHLACHPLTASQYSSNLAGSWPASASPISLDHSHQLYLQSR
jgi:hypothetical protein